MILFPCSKINIGLDVTARRDDGYHELETVLVPVGGLCDILEIVPGKGRGARFESSGRAVDCPADKNLCIKAYDLLAERCGIPAVTIHLHKIIPFGAGLGGGSADAAYVIKGLDRLFSLGLSTGRMESLAAELGSDTAFFIRGTAQLARGRGEILSPTAEIMTKLRGKRLVIVKPPQGVSTAEAYSGITPRRPLEPLAERLAGDPQTWKDRVTNDFEKHIFEAHPRLAEIKRALYEEGAVYASMSGSGSAMYGIFDLPDDEFQRPAYTPLPDEPARKLKERFADAFVYQQIM